MKQADIKRIKRLLKTRRHIVVVCEAVYIDGYRRTYKARYIHRDGTVRYNTFDDEWCSPSSDTSDWSRSCFARCEAGAKDALARNLDAMLKYDNSAETRIAKVLTVKKRKTIWRRR